MSYVDQHLSTREQILHRAFVSNVYVLMRPVIPLAIAVVIGLVIGSGSGEALAGATIVGVLGLLFFSVPMLIGGLVTKATTEVALTNQRVILKWGLVRRNTIETYLDKVESLTIDQSILGRLLGYGSVSVRGTGGGGTPCPGIASPQEFRRAVNEYVQNNRFASANPTAPPPAPQSRPAPPVSATALRYYFSCDGVDSGPHSLEEMRRLRQSGRLTDETFVFQEGDEEWQPAIMFSEICFEG
jgi:hypothetical protein